MFSDRPSTCGVEVERSGDLAGDHGRVRLGVLGRDADVLVQRERADPADVQRTVTDVLGQRGVDGQRHGGAQRDKLWGHPDLLPTSDDLDEPLDFVTRQGLDDELAALTADDAENPTDEADEPEGPAPHDEPAVAGAAQA